MINTRKQTRNSVMIKVKSGFKFIRREERKRTERGINDTERQERSKGTAVF